MDKQATIIMEKQTTEFIMNQQQGIFVEKKTKIILDYKDDRWRGQTDCHYHA